MEFKFDNTRLSYWHMNKIGRTEFFLLLPDFANFLPCWPAQFWWDSQQGKKLAKSGSIVGTRTWKQSLNKIMHRIQFVMLTIQILKIYRFKDWILEYKISQDLSWWLQVHMLIIEYYVFPFNALLMSSCQRPFCGASMVR